MNSDDPVIQNAFDKELSSYSIKKQSHTAAVARNQRMQILLGQFSSATTPAAKADIANAMQFEQVQIQNDAQMLANLEKLHDKEEALLAAAKARAYMKETLSIGTHWTEID
jgi:type IV secretion system protein VirB5